MSSTNGKGKVAQEFYPTPAAAVEALMRVVTPRPGDLFLEPCRGNGVIIDRVALPPWQKVWAELSDGVDYLATPFPPCDLIITNPPFSLSEEFIRKSLSELKPDGTMIYLQRVNFLGSLIRVDFWKEVGFPNKTPIIIPRPRFVGGGSDSCEYTWLTWDRGGRVSLPDGLSHLITKPS
jgi:hypothetical protein